MGVVHSSQALSCLENPPEKNNSGKSYSITVPDSETSTRSAVRRCGLQQQPDDGPLALELRGASTVYENFKRAARFNPDGPCLGQREAHALSGEEAAPYVFETFSQIEQRVDNFASGLEHEGLTLPTSDGMKLLAIFSKNRPEWVIAEQAAYTHSATTVPLYDALGSETVEFVVKQTGLTTVVCEGAAEVRKLSAVAEKCWTLKNVIVVDDEISNEDRASAAAAELRLYAFKELENIGAAHKRPRLPPSPTDVATFCYTSGTTGEPKGALISHRNLIVEAVAADVMGVLNPTLSDVYFSYLPLPHIFERVAQVVVFSQGASVGFSRGNPKLLIEDIKALRPTCMPAVPRILNRLHDKITQGALAAGGVKARLFSMACEAKVQGLHHGRATHILWDRLVFNKIKAKLGLDRIRMMAIGSAPVATHVLTFMRILMGVPLLEGYGQTETTGGATMTHSGDYSAGHVGGPFNCTEICLKDVPEMGYLHTDKWHGRTHGDGPWGGIPCVGRGEVCFRGHNVFVGYYKQEGKTNEAFDEDGWLQSGDIGLWTMDGALKIIDRKKNIFKLSQGEYVAPEKLEMVHAKSPLVAQSYVHGDSLQSYLVAIVVPDAEAVAAWAKAYGLGDAPLTELCKTPELKAKISEELETAAKTARLPRYEHVRAIHLECTPFSTDNGLMTPTLKLKRNDTREAYASVIQALYASVNAGASA